MTAATAGRLEGLDIFRGLAVAGMILVNTPGSGAHVWWPLDHAAWHGFTPTDLVFPAFLFAVGAALGLSFPRRIDGSSWWRILRRAASLVLIAWVIQLLARPDIEHFRFMGVLQRIALCYVLVSAWAIATARRDAEGRAQIQPLFLLMAAIDALILYWLLLMFIPVPGQGAGLLTPEGNLAGWVDRSVFGTAHIWRFGTDAAGNIVYDPEGLLSTLPALANVLFGMLAAWLWKFEPGKAVLRILGMGALLAMAGWVFSLWMPLNKRIWTPSFALFTTGLSAVLLATCMLASASETAKRLLTPLHIFGMNAILGYVLSLLIAIACLKPILPGGGNINQWGFAQINAVIPDPYLASFLYALVILLIVLAVLIPLHRRGIHLRL
ncbi:heparan-alpha-glucosaminide N-acetyltransferase domain-containing protein [Sphingomonas sp. AOB5]|uniref:acyltransferase family protein n=1 Tax=Sphingomonas sp. AOB5 TaxID=3034017 RepID=UPI0023F7C5F8|nr:heparan-alpha-glucosaminide N-acetyltransferase domain-containing protein [Sphingomonas sp. AOB5]MDF7774683.1 heparan-alpha-glucosaminide N-acetyltransferase domain-containing protein [Sphingomonas sp. AOB5]